MSDAGSPPPFAWLDWPRALAIVDDDVALLAHLVDVFIGQYTATADELRSAVRADDWTGAARRAHQLAGAAGAIGALALEQLARRADGAARQMVVGAVTPDLRLQSLTALGSLVQGLESTLEQAAAWRRTIADSGRT